MSAASSGTSGQALALVPLLPLHPAAAHSFPTPPAATYWFCGLCGEPHESERSERRELSSTLLACLSRLSARCSSEGLHCPFPSFLQEPESRDCSRHREPIRETAHALFPCGKAGEIQVLHAGRQHLAALRSTLQLRGSLWEVKKRVLCSSSPHEDTNCPWPCSGHSKEISLVGRGQELGGLELSHHVVVRVGLRIVFQAPPHPPSKHLLIPLPSTS